MEDITVNNDNNDSNEAVSIEERIKNATLENYSELLDGIATIESKIKREAYITMLAKKLGVKVGSIKSEMEFNPEATTSELCALFPELVDLVEDNEGRIVYLVKQDDGIDYTDSWTRDDGSECYPPERKHLNFTLGNSIRVQEYYARNEDPADLYDDLVSYFKRFSYLPDDTWPIIVFCTLLSYMQDHADVNYIPMIYFHAVAERGKSRTAKSFLSVTYRGVHLGDVNGPNIFRFSENLNATLFFDCTDIGKVIARSGNEDIFLNRFEKGATVPRVLNPDKGAFRDQTHFNIFGSTVVATNEPANYIFESRCISIPMPNKPGEYEDIKPVMGLELKERLIAWRASMMDKHLPDVDKIPGLNGRPWDISKPLFQLCEMVKPEVKEDMCRVLLGLVEKKAESKRESIEGQIIAAIDCVAEFESVGQIIIPTGEILKEVNFDKSDRYKMSPQKLGKRLQSLGLNTEISGGYSRLYVSQDELNLLKEQYGLLECTESAADNDVNDDDLHEIEDTNMRVVESVESVGTIPTNKISGCGLQIEDNETNFWD